MFTVMPTCYILLCKKLSLVYKAVRNALGTVNVLYNLLEGSAKRHSRFKAVQAALDDAQPPRSLQRLCDTRWASKYRAVDVVKSRYEAIIQTLELIAEDRECGLEAEVVLKSIATFHFYFLISVLDALLLKTSALSEYLQGSKLEMHGVKHAVTATLSVLDQSRKPEIFELHWHNASATAARLCLEEPSISRRHRVPRRLKECSIDTVYVPLSPKDEFHSIYFEILDVLRTELDERFKSNHSDVLIALERLLTDAAVETSVNLDALKIICHICGDDFDGARLQSQLELFYTEVKAYLANAVNIAKQDPDLEEDHTKECRKDTTVHTVSYLDDLFREEYFNSMYCEVYHLIKIYRVIPVSSASSERSFSTLRRVKTWLRSSMTEDRLSDLSLMNIEREETLNLESQLDSLVSAFTLASDRRLCLA
jgi:hypothetical protein